MKDFLAEDFVMGNLAAARGDGVILSSYVIEHHIGAQTLGGQSAASPALESQHAPLASRGLRRTALHQPAAAGVAALGGAPGMVAGRGRDALAARRRRIGYRGLRPARSPDGALFFLVPLQDILSFAMWLAGFFGNTILWRGRKYYLQADGRILRIGGLSC